jgi:hypothetical protein
LDFGSGSPSGPKAAASNFKEKVFAEPCFFASFSSAARASIKVKLSAAGAADAEAMKKDATARA